MQGKIEECADLRLDFKKLEKAAACGADVVPVVVQNADSGEVILLAYTNEAAFRKAMREKKLILWSTSRNELWEKGKTSGHGFDLVEAYVNCEQNSLLYKVRPRSGGICHTFNSRGEPRNCFYRKINMRTLALENTDP